jgi:diphthine-ammonia ligase
MRVVVHWGGGKDSCLAYHKAVKLGYDVAYLITYVYREPYIFHSFKLMELQSDALGVPQRKVKIKHATKDVFNALARLKKEEKIEGLVTGDIANVNHKPFYEETCRKIGLDLITPLWDPNGDHLKILNEELSTGIKPVFGCIDIKYSPDLDNFAEKWIGHEIEGECFKELISLCSKNKLDPCGETPTPWYHTMVVDSPLFRASLKIDKYKRKTEGSNRYMEIEKASLIPKDKTSLSIEEEKSHVAQTDIGVNL